MMKEHRVVMLATDEPTKIYKARTGGLGCYDKPTTYTVPGQGQHLYIISDEEIKEGDWCYAPNAINDKVMNKWTKETLEKYPATAKAWKKIIATTDPKLRTDNTGVRTPSVLIPQIPASFIEFYVKNPVETVELEYEVKELWDADELLSSKSRLKLDNNYVEPVINAGEYEEVYPKMYTREEVESLCNRAYSEGRCWGRGYSHTLSQEQWLEKHL